MGVRAFVAFDVVKQVGHRDPAVRPDQPVCQQPAIHDLHQMWAAHPQQLGRLIGGQFFVRGEQRHVRTASHRIKQAFEHDRERRALRQTLSKLFRLSQLVSRNLVGSQRRGHGTDLYSHRCNI